MKQLEFETIKGRFLLNDECKGISLKEITEEQAIEIVGSIKELHSLLKSKGIHLFENPYESHQDKDLEWFHNELTFYNPYIFKL